MMEPPMAGLDNSIWSVFKLYAMGRIMLWCCLSIIHLKTPILTGYLKKSGICLHIAYLFWVDIQGHWGKKGQIHFCSISQKVLKLSIWKISAHMWYLCDISKCFTAVNLKPGIQSLHWPLGGGGWYTSCVPGRPPNLRQFPDRKQHLQDRASGVVERLACGDMAVGRGNRATVNVAPCIYSPGDGHWLQCASPEE